MMQVAPGRGDPQTWVLQFIQEHEQGPRGFILAFQRSFSGSEIAADLFPLQADGSLAAQSCRMQFRMLPDLLSGETDPDSCRFGEGENSIGLLKEIALSEDRIIIADQLVRSDAIASPAADILSLYRLDRFAGSVRSRTEVNQAWRLSEPVTLEVGGASVEPMDAADMSLDVQVRLLLVYEQNGDEPLLHLQAVDAVSSQILGQTWADAQVEQIGMALDQVQINLVRVTNR
jgi:hypothetical protein